MLVSFNIYEDWGRGYRTVRHNERLHTYLSHDSLVTTVPSKFLQMTVPKRYLNPGHV